MELSLVCAGESDAGGLKGLLEAFGPAVVSGEVVLGRLLPSRTKVGEGQGILLS